MEHKSEVRRTPSLAKTPSVRKKLRKTAPSKQDNATSWLGLVTPSSSTTIKEPKTPTRPPIFRMPSAKSCPPTPKGTRAMAFGQGDQEQDETPPELPAMPYLLKPDTYVPREPEASRSVPTRPAPPPREPSSYDSEPPSTTGHSILSRPHRSRPKTPVHEIGQLERRSGGSSCESRSRSNSSRSERERASSVDLIAGQYQAVVDSRLALESAEDSEEEKERQSPRVAAAEDEHTLYLNRPLPPTPPLSLRSRRGHGPDHLNSLHDTHQRHSGQPSHNRHASHPPPTSDPRLSAASVAGTFGGRSSHVRPTLPQLSITTDHLDNPSSAPTTPTSAPTTALSDGSTLTSLQDDAFYFKPVSLEPGPGPVLMQDSPPPSALLRQFPTLPPLPQRPQPRGRAATVGAEAAPRSLAPPPRHHLVPPAPVPIPAPVPVVAAAAAAVSAVGTPEPQREDMIERSRNAQDRYDGHRHVVEAESDADDNDDTSNVSLQICLDLLTRELSAAMRRGDRQRQRQGQQRRVPGHRRGLGPADMSSSSTTTSASSLSFSSAQSRPASPSLSATSSSTSTGTSALQVWLMIEAYERVREEMARLRSNTAAAAMGSGGGGRCEQARRVADVEVMLDTWLRALYQIHEEMVVGGGQHQHREGGRGEGEGMGLGDWERGNFF
ncbi:hypothetical protein VTJ49DRAFT_3716 [Mycothermus thermophilus]|uniref:Uncharacterized protein n=1 Tax=Humicola insolens TaxID=85995 RepID=A0ABR3VP36_HUMIN